MAATQSERERFPELFVNSNIDRRDCKRVVPMKVICLGMPRTGTQSMRFALKKLGFEDTYHMECLFENPPDINLWRAAFLAKFKGQGKPFEKEQWDQLLGHCQAVTDLPTCAFIPELLAAYPEAKLILSPRDENSWYKSCQRTVHHAAMDRSSHVLAVIDPQYYGRLIPLVGLMFSSSFPCPPSLWDEPEGRQIWIDAYRHAHEEARALVPEHQRLEYKLEQGWAPLCKFLDVEEPDVEFPQMNDSGSFEAKMAVMKRLAVVRVAKSWSPFLAVAIDFNLHDVSPKYLINYVSQVRQIQSSNFETSSKTAMSSPKTLRIGYVPEHFSTPLHFARIHYGLNCTLVPFPSGTGHMITSLQAKEIDIGIGLTEGWIAGLGKATAEQRDAGYKLVGTYVETPLCWAISTGADRDDLHDVQQLKSTKMGVSRIGSGSYVMGFVLADTQNWLSPPTPTTTTTSATAPFTIIPLQTFTALRSAVTAHTADFFMWEHYTTKRHHTSGALKRLGEIYTPWPSWHIVASNDTLEQKKTQLEDVMTKLDRGIEHFYANVEEVVEYCSKELDYEPEDAREWVGAVRFAVGVRGVRRSVVLDTVAVLRRAGVLGGEVGVEGMVGIGREE